MAVFVYTLAIMPGHQKYTSNFFCVSSAVQSQNAVSAYFTSKQILHFGFAEQSCIPLSYDLLVDYLVQDSLGQSVAVL